MVDVRETFLPFAVKSTLASQVRVDCDSCLQPTQPQLVVSRSTLTRSSSMNNHKALRGADFFCSLSAAKQGYAASSHSLKYCQSNVRGQLSVHLLNQPIR